MNSKFNYNREAALKLYKPIFKKRLFLSIILFFSAYLILFTEAILLRMLRINNKVLDDMSMNIFMILAVGSFLFFLFNLAWYSNKKTWGKNSHIELTDTEIKYFYDRAGGVKSGSVFKYSCDILRITKIEENWENIIITGIINRKNTLSKNGYFETIGQIDIPKVLTDIDKFLEYAKSKVEK